MSSFQMAGKDISHCQFSAVSHPPAGKYGAAQSSSLRAAPKAVLRPEEGHLPQRDRDKIQSITADELRNFSIGGWAMRKHLDFVATHNFHCSHDSQTLSEDLEGFIEEWTLPENFDIRRRLDLHQWTRTAEATALTGGDMLCQKFGPSCHVQAIEPHQIRDPEKAGDNWFNGVELDKYGGAKRFAVWHNLRRGGYKFDRYLKAEEVVHFGYFTKFNQARGISPYTASLDLFRQTANAVRYTQAKQIIGTMLGLVYKTETPNGKKINLSGGPFVAEIGTDEEMSQLADKTPSTEFDNFLRHCISMALKAVDLPYNFYDERYTNFFGSRAALNLYLMACGPKRRRVRNLLNHLTKWRLNWLVSKGRFRLPRSMDLDELVRKYCGWIPIGMQWWNPLQEAKAAEILIKQRLKSRSQITREVDGTNWHSFQAQIDKEEKRIGQETATNHDPKTSTLSDISDQIDDLRNELEEIKGMAA